MKIYIIMALCVSCMFAGTYDDSYAPVNAQESSVSSELDPFMHGDFLEIKRFKQLSFDGDDILSSAKEDLNAIAKTIHAYIAKEKNIQIKIIGHASIDEEQKSSQEYAQSIAQILEAKNISKELMVVESRGSKDPVFSTVTQEGVDLSNRVMVTMYVLAPKEKDSDEDGVLDSKDECPKTPSGVGVDIKGCPLDSDKDGVFDYKDACPDTPQSVEVNEKGCPLDTDKDGVLDYKDTCPYTLTGLKVDAEGCHISRELKLNFANKSSEIKPESYSQVENFALFLKENTAYNAKIIGHTDSVGKAGYNMQLSLKRAQSVKVALEKEGVSPERIEAIGRGELSPLESNRTKAGRAINRRIEVKLFN